MKWAAASNQYVKNREGISHPDRNEQFEYINAMADEFLVWGNP